MQVGKKYGPPYNKIIHASDMIPADTTVRTKNLSMQVENFKKSKKNSGKGPELRRHERGSQNFSDFLKFSTLHPTTPK